MSDQLISPCSEINEGSHLNHETIRRKLAQRAGGAADAKAVAEAAISTWQAASVRLALVIGGQGVDVLIRRSLYLTGKTFPWLAVAGGGGGTRPTTRHCWPAFRRASPAARQRLPLRPAPPCW